jgi:5'-nucleotidase
MFSQTEKWPSKPKKRILLCNDDGYQAPGLRALYDALSQLPDVCVEVLAPEHNNSAKSNALTLHGPLYVYTSPTPPHFRYVNGTPADCIHIGLTGLLDYRPDLVVSGMNDGANLGDDTLYSGTVGAAMEAFLFGIPAIAFSQTEKGWAHLEVAAEEAKNLVTQLLLTCPHFSPVLPQAQTAWLLNVNIPNHAHPLPLRHQVCRLGRRHAAQPVMQQLNPRGQIMYWIGSAGAAKDNSPGTDFYAALQGDISITPLHIDLTDNTNLDVWTQYMTNSTI